MRPQHDFFADFFLVSGTDDDSSPNAESHAEAGDGPCLDGDLNPLLRGLDLTHMLPTCATPINRSMISNMERSLAQENPKIQSSMREIFPPTPAVGVL